MSNHIRGNTGQHSSVHTGSSHDTRRITSYGSHDNHDSSDASDVDLDLDLLSSDAVNDGDLGRNPPSNNGAFRSGGYLHPSASASPSPSRSPSNTPTRTIQQRRQRDSLSSSSPHHIPFLNKAALDKHLPELPLPALPDVSYDFPPNTTSQTRPIAPYDDLTAIDWIQEYSRERARKRHLHSHSSSPSSSSRPSLLWHQVRQIADDAQAWWILVATGIAVGVIAASIDIVVEWLADLKTGVCAGDSAGGGAETGWNGQWYLKRGFCCWGVDDVNTQGQCDDWKGWAELILGQGRSDGAEWIVAFLGYILGSVVFASLAAVLVTRFSSHARQSGIPEIKTVLGGFVIRKFMGLWTLLIKSLGLCLAVASGLVLGKEGPLVHVACCCANLFMKPFEAINTNEARKREVLSAAAASGISVAFGAPVGGVLFSLEQLSYYFPDKTMWQSFVCAMIAAFTLKAFDPFRTGKVVQYQVTYHTGWHGFEILPFIVIGILGGLYGGLFIKLNMRLAKLRQSSSYPLRNRPVLEVAVVATLTAVITFPITFLRAQATELDYYLFAECIDITNDPLGLCKSGIANTGVIFLLLVSSLLAFLLASLTFGLQIPAGILLPSMTIGALYGRVIGLIMEVWQREHPTWIVFASCEPDIPCVTPGTYAIIGAASALAGATRMTVSIVVIMFELTGALTYVLPIMIAVMIAKWVGDAIGKKGIYESWIQFQGYPFLDNKDDKAVPDVPVSQIMTRFEDLIALAAEGNTIAGLRDVLQKCIYRGFPVVTTLREGVLLGYISRAELMHVLAINSDLPGSTRCFFFTNSSATDTEQRENALDLGPYMDHTPLTLNANSGFALVVNMFQRLGLRYLLFVERGALKGVLTKKDVWVVLNEDENDHGGAGARAGEEGRFDGGMETGRIAGAGVLREDGEGESRGLLGRSGGGGIGLGIHEEEEDEDDEEDRLRR